MMPWHVSKSSECPASKPWAVIKDSNGEVEGCHATKAAANKQLKALYANEGAKKMAMPAKMCVRSVFFTRSANAEEITDGRTLEGYGAVFDTPTVINDWDGTYEEEIAHGAFRKSLRARKPKLQFDHGYDRRTGSVPIGAVQDVREDDHGLYVKARLFENDVVEPIRQAIEAEAIDGMSFRFNVVRDEWRDKDDVKIKEDELWKLLWDPGDRGPLKRTIKEVELFELGPVVFPAYDSTSVGVRSLLSQISTEERDDLVREVARLLRTHISIGYLVRHDVSVNDEENSTRHAEDTGVEETESTTLQTEGEPPAPNDVAGQSDARSTDGSEPDAESRSDEDASTPPEHAAAETRREQTRRIRDAILRSKGIVT
jgi:hypothetical protein